MEQNLIKKQFNRQEITFDLSGEGMINATEMAKANGKHIPHFFENKENLEYIKVLSETVGIPTESLIIKKEGRNGGTWVHRKLAIRIAQWCSPKFAVQVDSWIEELFLKGKVELKPKTIEEMTLLVMQDLQSKVAQQQKQLEEQKPKVEFADAVNKMDDTLMDLGEFAKIYSSNSNVPLGRTRLFELLREKGVFMGSVPKQKFLEAKMFVVKPVPVEALGELKSKTFLTVNGVKWLVGKLNQHFKK